MGQRHADRITLALRHASKTARTPRVLQPRRRPPTAFFTKNLEQVQGDERDAIIHSIGYRKGANGRLSMAFGPRNNDGGERCLNVAIPRARETVTVVSSFTHHDFDGVTASASART